MTNISNQELFDKVATHLLTQNERSGGGEFLRCAYKGENGLSCAVGCLIDDQVYDPKIENMKADRSDVVKAVERSLNRVLNTENMGLLLDLQGIHDRTLPEQWPTLLKCLAKNWELSPAVLDTLAPSSTCS